MAYVALRALVVRAESSIDSVDCFRAVMMASSATTTEVTANAVVQDAEDWPPSMDTRSTPSHAPATIHSTSDMKGGGGERQREKL